MANCVNTAMNAVQPATPDPPRDAAVPDSGLAELIGGDDPVLPGSDPRDQLFGIGGSCPQKRA
jgi:hypothetical protein